MSYKKILRAVFFMSLPLLLAACSSSNSIFSSGSNLSTDTSISYLTQVFGTVGPLQGNGNQLLGQMFGVFNLGILSLIGAFLIYTTFTVALRCAIEGNFNAGNKPIVFTFLKIVFGVALVIPTSGGYCYAQKIMMNVIVAGVELADNVWGACIDYIGEGNSLWSGTPGDGSTSLSEIFNDQTFISFMGDSTKTPAFDTPSIGLYVLSSELCMLDSNMTLQPKFVTAADGSQQLSFPNSLTDNNSCGYVTPSTIFGDTSTLSDGAYYDSLANNAVSAVSSDMMPAALYLHCQGKDKDTNQCASYQNSSELVSGAFESAAIDYTNSILPGYEKINAPDTSGTINQDLEDNAKKDGWLGAGSTTWSLAQAQKIQLDLTSLPNYIPCTKSAHCPDQAGTYQIGYLTGYSNPSDILKWLGYAQSGFVSMGTASDALAAQSSNSSGSSDSDTSSDILSAGTSGIAKINNVFKKTSSYTNPVAWLLVLGQSCLDMASEMWLSILGIILVTGIVSFIMSGCNPAGYVFDMVISWVTPVILVLCGLLISAGATLAFYVPCYAYIVWTFAAVAFFIAVIDSMVAVSVVALGVTSPDNHDMLGKAEQAIMLAVGVFLRPSLMIFGLVSGMVLSSVAFSFVNYSFTGFMGDLYTASFSSSSGSIFDAANKAQSNIANGNPIMLMISTPILLVMFSSIVIEVLGTCYSLIYLLPDYVLKWCGGPQSTSIGDIEKHVSAVKSAAGEVAKGLADASGEFAKGAGSGLKAMSDRKKDDQDRAAAKASAGGGGGGGGGG